MYVQRSALLFTFFPPSLSSLSLLPSPPSLSQTPNVTHPYVYGIMSSLSLAFLHCIQVVPLCSLPFVYIRKRLLTPGAVPYTTVL